MFLGKGMETHCSILAWRIPMDKGTWRATVYGLARVRHTWAINWHTHTEMCKTLLRTEIPVKAFDHVRLAFYFSKDIGSFTSMLEMTHFLYCCCNCLFVVRNKDTLLSASQVLTHLIIKTVLTSNSIDSYLCMRKLGLRRLNNLWFHIHWWQD